MPNHIHGNRLSRETSPYLLQHQHNPVDWYAWGPEAFEASRSLHKPIFLSVGYSTCYWCHVMERECFENESIATLMNELFINIKVDREERADVDQLYMTAVQVLTQHGGWPMSVFLLPDLRPFWGGTYFPPADAYGRPGFPTVLRAISEAFQNRRGELEQSAAQLQSALVRLAKPQAARREITIDHNFIDDQIQRATADYESAFGGFGSAPKFPRETLLELLLASDQIRNPQSVIRNQLKHSLDAMANGGIRDHLGGGFHRYSTDAKWLVPHFEIMLYDNAMLGAIYADASKELDDPRYARIARGVFDFILREMTSADGAFYTALDAEVDAQEGLSYLWTREEVLEVIGTGRDALAFCKIYGIDAGPNFVDPHHGGGTAAKNILHLIEGMARESDPVFIAMREKLLEARHARKQPLLDTKIITSWNALMIGALSRVGMVLKEPRYVQAAVKAAEFLLSRHWSESGQLQRTSREGKLKHNAMLDDYAYLADALLSLMRATGEAVWRDRAVRVVDAMIERFREPNGAFFFTQRDAEDLVVRQMVGTDSPLPSGNAIAARVLMELGREQDARQVITTFATQMQQAGESMSSMVHATMIFVRQFGPLGIAPDSDDSTKSVAEEAAEIVHVSAELIDPACMRISLRIRDGYYIQANHAADGLIQTTLSTSVPSLVRSIKFPSSVDQTYRSSIAIEVQFIGDIMIPIQFTLRYQPCKDGACLAPVTKQFKVEV